MKAMFPASFDPITLGHLDLIERATDLFDEVHVVVMDSQMKHTYFSAEQRLQMVMDCVGNKKGVTVVRYDGLTCDYLRRNEIRYVVRGLRNGTDFDYEMNYYAANRSAVDVEMIFLPTKQELFHISSSVAREVIVHGCDGLEKYVPAGVAKKIREGRL